MWAGGMKRPFILKKRGKYWYYKLAGQKTYHSTGKVWQNHAEAWVISKLKLNAEPSFYVEDELSPDDIPLREYIEPFFDWDRCPHGTRLREEGKSFSERYAENQRRRKERYICDDEIVDLKMRDIKRSHILAFRRRLIDNGTGGRTINLTIGILKIVFHEALFREDIDRDPTLGIGNIKYDEEETGIFTRQEIIDLFTERPGVWRDLQGYTAFLLAAHCGLRRSEVLALIWGQLDLADGAILVNRAMTGNGLPKWDKTRSTLMTAKCVQALKELRAESEWVLPHQYVFSRKNGQPRGFTWWKKRFETAMVRAGHMRKENGKISNPRRLEPHSFRHTLNTLLRAEDVDPAKLRATFGWSSEAVQDGYTHWRVEHFEAQRRKIEELLG
jgi:integrase